MIESVSVFPSFQRRHRSAPLLKEREEYLTHLLRIGRDANHVRSVAAYLIHIVHIMELTNLRPVKLAEIEEAGARWASDRGPERRGHRPETSPRIFTKIARQWMLFKGFLAIPAKSSGHFDSHLAEFRNALQLRGLASITIKTYVQRTQIFLRWASERFRDLPSVSLRDVDDFLASNHKAGWRLSTLTSHCISLRAFFIFAEERGLCSPRIWRGIVGPPIPQYVEVPKGPSWANVRRLIRSIKGRTSAELRSRALLLLYSIYGLRASEVARLRIGDFDWRNETFCVHRAKRGGIQQFPIQYEVGEAILDYLQHGRPQCACRFIFLTLLPPYRPLTSGAMWDIVSKRIKNLGIQAEHRGPHSLRHACATYLLKRGSSLKEIADFLGHRTTKSVAIYAKYDQRSLRKVAAFSLAGIL
ncbi:site-specific integrase [Terriglobus albidus]|uniref:site-specific integrase n=1 Tax=Terriglobus albidus TaxID=1592106 RepID=UPI0021E092EE|nr:site-specific integrase [Terriglobus albidus]